MNDAELPAPQVPPTPRSRASLAWKAAATAAVVVGLLLTLRVDLSVTGYPRALITLRNDALRDDMAWIDAISAQISDTAGSKTSNVLLRFDNFYWVAGTNTQVIEFYFRLNYAAYPRRIYVLDDATPFDAKTVVDNTFRPDAAWLKAHDVRTILHVVKQPGTQAGFILERLP